MKHRFFKVLSFLPPQFPPPWANEWGEDGYGLWVAFMLQEVRQAFRWIPAGTFLMGSPEDEPGRFSNERQHTVTLTKGFWLADTTCTQALWQQVMGENPAKFQDHTCNPVEQVSWHDVQVFLEKLNELVPGLSADLPTEAEWEYGCRAGTETPFSFGRALRLPDVNYRGTWGWEGPDEWGKGAVKQTVAVKSLPANPWGLYEMHGNVWEWCRDWYCAEYPSEAVDPIQLDGGDDAIRVLRGGSWISNGRNVRSALRDRHAPHDRNVRIGFRFSPGQQRTMRCCGGEPRERPRSRIAS